jgi:hypothetical protein
MSFNRMPNILLKIIPNFFWHAGSFCKGIFLVLHPIYQIAKISKEIGQNNH